MERPKRFYRHMTWQKAEEIRALYFSRRLKQVELARRFKVAPSTISRIVSGFSWGEHPTRKHA